jgi:hypothetical protein
MEKIELLINFLKERLKEVDKDGTQPSVRN